MSQDTVPADVKRHLDQIGAADLVIGVPGPAVSGAWEPVVRTVRTAVESLSPSVKTIVLLPAEDAGADPAAASAAADGRLSVVACAMPPVHRFPLTSREAPRTLSLLRAVCTGVGARACGIIGSNPETVHADALRLLVEPVLGADYDLVVPRYAAHTLDGLINTGIVYPFTRALYGKRVRGQIGVDFGFSARFLERAAEPDSGRRPLWFATHAVTAGLRVCQANLGIRLPPASEAMDLSTTLSQVMASLFLDVERTAQFWQRVRRSEGVESVGAPAPVVPESDPVDVRAMIESFLLGYRNLREVWGLILPPATLVELGRLARAAPEQFRLPDALWARIVFDFALGHRLRTISRDHLLRAMTPVYLAWVASFVPQLAAASPAAFEERLERLCTAYESEKTYLLSRWRWPDRFQP